MGDGAVGMGLSLGLWKTQVQLLGLLGLPTSSLITSGESPNLDDITPNHCSIYSKNLSHGRGTNCATRSGFKSQFLYFLFI